MLQIFLIAAVLCFSNTKAQSIQVDSKRATVSFVFLDGEVEGSLSDFIFQGHIDAKDLKLSRIKGSVKTASLDTDNWLRSRHLRSKKYFNAKNHPRLYFDSKSILQRDGYYLVRGLLTIKGVAQSVDLKLRQEQDLLVLTGQINTQDFDIDIYEESERNRVGFKIQLPLIKD